MATQNPIEQEGTYPLPEAQLDRFFFKLLVGYSTREELSEILDRTTTGTSADVEPVLDGPTILAAPGTRALASSSPRTCRTTPCVSCSPRTRRASSPRPS